MRPQHVQIPRLLAAGLTMVCLAGWILTAFRASGGPFAPREGVSIARASADIEQAGSDPDWRPAGPQPPPAALCEEAPSEPPAFPLDVNRASAAELMQVPGIGPVLAERIVQARRERGGFLHIDELREVRGIGPSTFESLRDWLKVEPL